MTQKSKSHIPNKEAWEIIPQISPKWWEVKDDTIKFWRDVTSESLFDTAVLKINDSPGSSQLITNCVRVYGKQSCLVLH